jgi:hypothetical protein
LTSIARRRLRRWHSGLDHPGPVHDGGGQPRIGDRAAPGDGAIHLGLLGGRQPVPARRPTVPDLVDGRWSFTRSG